MRAEADIVLATALAYVAGLFLLAWRVDRWAARGGARWLRSPVVYTLSLSVYCTAWTFYGAVGSAARSGLEYLAIYLGPTLMMVGWWWTLRKIVRIGRTHRITSIADMISSRYGKSNALAAAATVVAVVATAPYIALQLQSLTKSWAVISGGGGDDAQVAMLAAAGLALFTILFGTRSLDENERHYGVVAAIAFEAVVKLAALVAVGLFAAFGVGALPGSDAAQALRLSEGEFGPRWGTLLFLSAAAMICLPRQFHVTVVENDNERHLATASWAFPGYLLLISACVPPIAAAGLAALPPDSNPDLFVLTLPMAAGQDGLAALAFIGGFSAATSMVIVSTIALSTMISNHIVAPMSVRLLGREGRERSGDVREILLGTRRAAIVAVLALGYAYFRLTGGSDALASVGAIAFCGAAQFLPAVAAGVAWRNATAAGALAGLVTGFAVWLYTLFLPSFGGGFVLSVETLAEGPWGIAALRPQGLFGVAGADPLVHATAWSVGLNAATLVLVSLATRMNPLERLQGALFVDAFRSEPGRATGVVRRSPSSADLFVLAQRILGRDGASALFADAARAQGRSDAMPDPTPGFVARLERELAGSVGAASAHAMVSRTAGGETISLTELMEIADENAELRRASRALEAKTREAEQIAAQLRAANARLRELDSQKDAFLSQVSHELRTPMTSVRSFAEILRRDETLAEAERRRFAGIIEEESIRLTRLLDEILDLTLLTEDAPRPAPPPPVTDAEAALDRAVAVALAPAIRAAALERGESAGPAMVRADPDRLAQVFINLLANALKHSGKAEPRIAVSSRVVDGAWEVWIEDDGPGVAPDQRERIFESFVRNSAAAGAGLGLPISRRIVQSLGGSLVAAPPRGAGGARFIARLPLAAPDMARPAAE